MHAPAGQACREPPAVRLALLILSATDVAVSHCAPLGNTLLGSTCAVDLRAPTYALMSLCRPPLAAPVVGYCVAW